MKIEIFYSKSILDPYIKPISELEYEKVHEWQEVPVVYDNLVTEKRLEEVFRLFNIGQHPFRSMCVGDVVIFDSEQAFYCDSVGWRDVTKQMIPSGDSIGFKEV